MTGATSNQTRSPAQGGTAPFDAMAEVAPADVAPADVVTLARRLQAAGVDADTAPRRLAEYSYDASNYRVPPALVAFPRSVAEARTALRFAAQAGVPVTGRGGGTSMAGNSIGPGMVVDFSRHMAAVGDVDEETMTVRVEPGIVLSTLTAHVESVTEGRCTFAPDPSSRTRATVGGAIGNDACGNHSVRYGRTCDHVVELDVLTWDGIALTASRGGLRPTDPADPEATERAGRLSEQLAALAAQFADPLRDELGRIPRQVSGYQLRNLLPEEGFDVARALVGSEGTCALVVGARMRVVPKPPAALLLCLGYADVVDAARDVPVLLEYRPAAVEGVDEAIVETMRWRRGDEAVTGMPAGKAWLYVDLDGEDLAEVEVHAAEVLQRLREDGRLVDAALVTDPVERAVLWRVREDGAGLSSRLSPEWAPDRAESWPGWEDSAVAPQRLPEYLAELLRLMAEYGIEGVMYGHFGAGCIHVRLTYDLRSAHGRKVFEDFTEAAARLVVAHGGSLSGEHGDGRARSRLLPIMYSPRMLEAFARYKLIWDPYDRLNPGSIVRPDDFVDNLALAGVPDREWPTTFRLPPTRGTDPFVDALQRCIGVGRCRTESGGVMCPSYRATRDEKDSTRGRARVLQEMVRGARSAESGWRSPEVREALDLCLSCKACATDCPVGVDMATYKAEFFDHYYARRIRPRSHYALGWLPRWLRWADATGFPLGRLLNSRVAPLLMRAAGLTDRRRLPTTARTQEWIRHVVAAGARRPGSGDGEAILFVDTFTKAFRPQVAGAVAAVMTGAGDRPECAADACCGLTWISTGQLRTARRLLAATAELLDDGTDRPIVVVEPSCAATLRGDLPELVDTDQARRVAARVTSFAAYANGLARENRLAAPGRAVPDEVVVQTHCHEYATFGAGTQRRVLAAVGVSRVREATGCCGVAGNFGFEAGHYDVSMAVASHALAPALQEGDPSAPVLTDGFSCAMQVDHLDPARPGRHLAELLDPRKGRP